MIYDFTGATVSSTYGRIVQVVHGSPDLYYDGFGNLLNLGSGTSSVGAQGPTGSQGISMVFQGEWDNMMMYFYYDFVTYNGSAYLCISDLTGSAPWTSPDVDTTHWQQMLIGLSGTSGTTGTSGTAGVNGTSGSSGVNGTSGIDGTSGTSGSTGTSGSSGGSGSMGTSGSAGTSGTSGLNGTSGTSGLNGTSGSAGTSGTTGTSGSSGSSGVNGTSGSSGTSVSTNYVYKTSAYSVLSSDYYIEVNGTFDVTLPTSVGLSGKTFIIKNSGTGIITIQTTSSQTIDNLPSYNLAFYDSLTVESNGSNWLLNHPSTKRYIRVYNNTGSIIPKGTALKIQSSYNGIPSVTLPIASSHTTNEQVIGLAYIDIPNASEGIALSAGVLSGLNLSSYSVGDILYLSDTVAGGFVNSSDSLQYSSRTNKIGYVTSTSSTIGTIQVELSNENLNLSITDIQRNILEGNVISTGLFDFSSPGISLYSSTKFNVATASGWIVYNVGTYSIKPEVKLIEYPGTTGVTASFLNTSTITYLLLDSNSQLIQQNTFPTPQQRRENIYLGKIGHADKSSLINVFNEPDIEYSPLSQVRDMFTPIKLINQGVYPSPHSTTLEFNTSSGTLWGLGIGSISNQLNPSSISISGQSPATFQYRTQLGGTSSNVTLIDPTKWDNLGTLTTITGAAKQATNQRIFLVQNGVIRVQYGQQVYADLSTAILNIQNEVFTTFSNFSNNGILIGILSVSSNATNLSDTSYAKFFLVSKFGELIGGSGGLSTTTLQQAYDNSSTPEIVTNSTLGAVTFKRGSTSDTDNVIEVQGGNGSGVTFSVTGQGKTTTNTLKIAEIGSTSSLTRYMVVDNSGNTYYQTTNPGGGSGTSGTSGNTGTSGTSGNNGTSGSSGVNGAGGALGYYGSFYDTSTQLNTTASIAMPMNINSTYEANGISLSNGSKMVFSNSGTYNIQFSTVFNKSNSASGLVDIWFSKNGNYITESNTSFNIAGQATTIASWNFINTVESNDYIQLYWSSPDTTISIVPTGTQSNPVRPAVPSVILTAQQVMYTQLGATGSNGTSGTSGNTGTSGTSGINGSLGTSGTSGTSGVDGTSGTSGSSGSQGTSGSDGTSGSMGTSGSSGSAGSAGTMGTAGTSGLLSLTGTTDNGIITLNGTQPNGTVETNLTFDGSILNVNGRIIASASTTTDLVTITQTGTGNAFVVEDSNSPDLNSFVIDKSGNVGIGIPSNSINSSKLYTFATSSVAIYGQSEGNYGVYGISQHPSYSGVSGVNSNGIGIFGISSNGLAIKGLGATIGVQGEVVTDFSGAIGVYGLVYDLDGGSGTYIGGKFSAGSGAGTNYSVQLLDGTEGVNKVLVSQTSDGKANWSSSLTDLTSVSTTTLNASQSSTIGSTTGDLVLITQGGSGNALVVQDHFNNDSSHFVVDGNGNVVIGATATSNKLDVSGNTRITGKIIGSASNNNIQTDALIQAGLLFLSNNC